MSRPNHLVGLPAEAREAERRRGAVASSDWLNATLDHQSYLQHNTHHEEKNRSNDS